MARTTLAPPQAAIREHALPVAGKEQDYNPLLDLIGDARVVLLGEASHGTHEFYHERARITRRLIEEKGFNAVAVEADWPDAYRVNRWVRGTGQDRSAIDALGGFLRFPRWMWRNQVVLAFIQWLRRHNDARSSNAGKVGFYGLDLYSLFSSIEEVIRFLEKVDPPAAARARYRYSCFDAFGEDTQAYGYSAEFGLTPSCEDQAVQQLVELQRRASELATRDGLLPQDEVFYAQQNARVVKNAEMYYRTMFRGRVESWNLRDRHMAETLETLIAHLERAGEAKVVVWEHNSHVGDARATAMGDMGEWNIGQLARQRFGSDAVLVGFSTYHGTVTAASDWDGPAERKRVRPGLPGSFESLFHSVGERNFMLLLKDNPALDEVLEEERLQRAIGVIYHPETERVSHYFEARLPRQFDAIIHLDETRAVEPLDRTAGWDEGEPPETFPTGL